MLRRSGFVAKETPLPAPTAVYVGVFMFFNGIRQAGAAAVTCVDVTADGAAIWRDDVVQFGGAAIRDDEVMRGEDALTSLGDVVIDGFTDDLLKR